MLITMILLKHKFITNDMVFTMCNDRVFSLVVLILALLFVKHHYTSENFYKHDQRENVFLIGQEAMSHIISGFSFGKTASKRRQ